MFPFPAMPPAAAETDPNFADVVLLTSLGGTHGSTSFTDESPVGRTLTRNGNLVVSNAVTLFGQNTGLFDGSGDYISTPDDSALSISNSVDKTIEGWFYLNTTGRTHALISKTASGSRSEFWIDASNTNKLHFQTFVGGSSSLVITGATTLSATTWYHFALVRSGTAWKMFLDGALDGSGTQPATPTASSAAFTIGRWAWNTSNDISGRLAEIRYTNMARYTAAFTRPTAKFLRS